MKTKFILSVLCCLFSLVVSAHALWIETAGKAVKGKPQVVAIYFGEYAENERDSVAKWFSNLKDVQLFLTAPDGNRKPVVLSAVTDHFAGSFTPEMDGAYFLTISHTVGEVFGTSKIEYYASATVLVGKASNQPLKAATLLSILPDSEDISKGKETVLTVYHSTVPLSLAKVEIASPKGWVKTLRSDIDGRVSFFPLEGGRYMLEAVRIDKTAGTHNGKPYQSVTHLVTHCVYAR